MKIGKLSLGANSWGMLALSILLILQGAMVLIPKLAFDGSSNIMAILALAAGILLLLGR